MYKTGEPRRSGHYQKRDAWGDFEFSGPPDRHAGRTDVVRRPHVGCVLAVDRGAPEFVSLGEPDALKEARSEIDLAHLGQTLVRARIAESGLFHALEGRRQLTCRSGSAVEDDAGNCRRAGFLIVLTQQVGQKHRRAKRERRRDYQPEDGKYSSQLTTPGDEGADGLSYFLITRPC